MVGVSGVLQSTCEATAVGVQYDAIPAVTSRLYLSHAQNTCCGACRSLLCVVDASAAHLIFQNLKDF